jgi:hypothetical protein
MQIDIIIHYEEKMDDPPKVLKSVTVYKNGKMEIISYLLADFLKNNDYCR